ncbi:perilipin-3-like [Tiliqua scincoides]|uniref:perilipin-3-like n=1 Tax=Tiliqua scincoides TaxID=71010 RepID=UPI003461C8CE
MATDVKGESQEAPETENVVTRMTNLPLVSSAYEMCSSLYNYAKETHPYITTACNIAEMVAAVAVGSAVGGAQPILNQLEPQIAAVNEYACQKLDKLEETLPFLQQPTHQVIEDGVTLTKTVVCSTVTTAMGAKDVLTEKVTKAMDLTKDIVQDSITLTKSVVSSTVNAANETKDLMTHRVVDVVNLGKETVKDSVDLTKSVVNTALQVAHGTKDVATGEVNRVVGKRCGAIQEGVEMTRFVRQMVSSGVDAMLEKTEELVDHYLPITEEELVKLSMEVKDFGDPSVEEQKKQQSYFIRLGSISHKVRHRAYLQSVNKLQLLKEKTQNMLSQLQLVINLIENVKQGTGQQFQEGLQKLQQLLSEWLQTQPGESQTAVEGTQPEVESRTLAMLRVITQDLGPAYLQLVSTIQGLPSHIYERLNQVTRNASELHGSFSSASSFQDLSASILTQCQEKIVQGREALDTLMEYVTQNTPLNWVVGPFQASPAPATKEVVMTEIEMLKPSNQESTKMDAGEAMTQPGEALKENIVASKPVRVLPKSAKKKVEAKKVKESTKALVVEEPKKAKLREEEAEQVEKPNRSSLNKASEASKEEP